MQTMVPLYGFGGGGGTGAALTVTAPAGCTVTVSKDGKTKTRVAGADGVAVFKGLATGQWTVNMTDGAQTAPTRTADITADYAITMSFFAATIHVTYPSGSTCTATDGVTTLTAPDTSGTWDCVVPNAGTWTITVTDKGWTYDVEISENGQSADIDIKKLWVYHNGEANAELFGTLDVLTYNGYKGSLTKNADGSVTISGNNSRNSAVAAFSKKFSNIGYKTLCINVVSLSKSNAVSLNALSSLQLGSAISQVNLASVIISATGVNSVSIDTISDFYVGVSAFNANFTFDAIWLE